MPSRRIERVNSEIKKVISNILLFKLKNDALIDNMVSVLYVDTSADLANAKIYITVFPKENEEKVLNALKISVPFIRKEMAKQINLRIVPVISFYIDETEEKYNRVEELLRQIKKDEQK